LNSIQQGGAEKKDYLVPKLFSLENAKRGAYHVTDEKHLFHF
jgi:hypothetical protein